MFTARSRICKVVLACAVFGLAACIDPDDQKGTLIVPFDIGNQRTCEQFDVESVRGELNNGKYVDEARCDGGLLRFEHVPEDTYNLRLYGYDRDDVVIMDSLQDDHLAVNVVGDSTVVVDSVALTSAPALLMMRWTFGFGTCESAGIDVFAVTAWRNNGSELLLDEELDCEEVGTGAGNYRQVQDDHRMLTGNDRGEVSVRALGRDGDEFCEPLTYEYAAPGPGREIYLSLACDEDACWGTGDEDKNRTEDEDKSRTEEEDKSHTGEEDKSL